MVEAKARHIVRVANTDLNGDKPVYHALNKITGISYSFANAICNTLDLDKLKKAGQLTPEEVKKIEDVIANPKKHNLPDWLLNRRKDYDTGEDMHLITSQLKLRVDFDVKNMKKIKSYKGVRHGMGLPARGQRTRAHFRHGASLGVQRNKVVAQPAKEKKE